MSQKEEIAALQAEIAALRAKLGPTVQTDAEIQKDRERRAALSEDVTVKFNQDYIASRGPGFVGRKGDVKTYPASKALAALCDSINPETGKPVVSVVKAGEVASRETATA